MKSLLVTHRRSVLEGFCRDVVRHCERISNLPNSPYPFDRSLHVDVLISWDESERQSVGGILDDKPLMLLAIGAFLKSSHQPHETNQWLAGYRYSDSEHSSELAEFDDGDIFSSLACLVAHEFAHVVISLLKRKGELAIKDPHGTEWVTMTAYLQRHLMASVQSLAKRRSTSIFDCLSSQRFEVTISADIVPSTLNVEGGAGEGDVAKFLKMLPRAQYPMNRRR